MRPKARSAALLATLLLSVAMAGVAFTISGAAAAVNPSDFADETRVTGMHRVVALEWLPSGEALILAQEGVLWKVDPATGNKTQYFTFPDVDHAGERGTLDLVKDPAFGTNGHIFVYYTTLSDQKLNIARFTYTGAGAADLSSLTNLWSRVNTSPNTNHVGGSIDVGPDDKLYLSIGDSVQSALSQQLDTVFGKILRINKDGTIPTDNPYHDGAGPNADEIYAYGVRNPWRGSFDDVTGTYFFGDVGGNDAPTAYEEINVLEEGANYGWADCQGPLGPPKNGPNCPGGVTAPIWYYDHDPGGGCCQNAAVTGGEVMRGVQLPTELDGAYVYGDFSMKEISYLQLDVNNNVIGDGLIKDNLQFPVWIGQGPDGHIYYLNFGYLAGQGQLRRLRYIPGPNQPPVITTETATPVTGMAPLDVQFTGEADDPENDPITYEWTFGDGTISNQQNPMHTYGTGGSYEAQLRVTAAGQTAVGSIIPIAVGQAPEATIISPVNGQLFSAGESVAVEGSATDDGPITNADYRWDISLVHGNHQHPMLTNLVGPLQTLDVPSSGHGWEGDTSILIQLTVTDTDGLTDVESVEIEPRKVPITVETEAGSAVIVDGVSVISPFVIDTVEGFEHTIAVLADVCVDGDRWTFDDWSDGDTNASRPYVVPTASETLTANFTNVGVCAAECNGLPVTVDLAMGQTPTSGNDVIQGTAGADVIVAGGGDDTVCSLGGDDVVNGGIGVDWVDAGPGDDIVYGQDGADTISGGDGADELLGFGGDDVLRGDGGDDVVNGGTGNDDLDGGNDDDQVFGQPGDDTVVGGPGHDLLLGSEGSDIIAANAGNDTANGGPGADNITGGTGDDIIYGHAGDDPLLSGMAGDDLVFGQLGDDVLFGGPDDDSVWGNEGDDIISDPSGTNVLNGGPDDDEINGGSGVDQIFGDGNLAQAGNDTIDGGSGSDLLVGFAGDDAIEAADGELDTVNGGPHSVADTCSVDGGLDVVYNCDP
ncbi:MAG: PQQ-dependent sugar dehydrogenase [Acidimicrobiales bacterium]